MLNHPTIFTHLRVIDRGIFYCNLILLMTIVFIRYPTEVFGEARRRGQGVTTAPVFYSVTMTVNAWMWASLWLYVDRSSPTQQGVSRVSAVHRDGDLRLRHGHLRRLDGIAFASPYACLAFHGALAVYYAVDPISRRVAREHLE